MKFGKIKKKSSILCLILSAYFSMGVASCPHKVNPPPAYWQCQLNGTPRALYCYDSNTNECMKNSAGSCVKVPVEAPAAKGSQCVFPEGFKALMAYQDYLIKEARKRCK